MCGVVGFWNLDGTKGEEAILQNMVNRLYHRGPDDQGTWMHQSLGLGHTRLSILDLSQKGHQPFVTTDKKGVLTFNGEIYNYLELREKLQEEGVSFQSSTDTEVLLYALHIWGPEKAIPLLEGMFAFAYFNLASQTLWLARDRAGIKPLYWVNHANQIIFASEMKALLDHPFVGCRPDMHTLTTLAIHMRLDGDWTPFEDVKCVIPGTMIKITQKNTQTMTYFDLMNDVNVEQIIQFNKMPEEELLNIFESTFAQSVKSHLVSDAPLATMCSGGLDSSYMTAIAHDYKPDIEAYVADLETEDVHEAKQAQIVCRHLGVKLNKVKIDQETYLRHWPQAVYANDQPHFHPQNVLCMLVANAAHHDGFKVLLAGEGSDELFGGYRWQEASYRMWNKRRRQSHFIGNNRVTRKLGSFFSQLIPLNFKDLEKHPFTRNPSDSFATQSAAAMSAVDGLQQHLRAKKLFAKLEKIQPIEERAFLARGFDDFYTHLRTLLRSNDKMTMAVSIESRVPFISNQCIDLGLHLNFRSKFKNGIGKYIVRKSAEKRLPNEIIHSKKIGFGISHNIWSNGTHFLKNGMISETFKFGKEEEKEIHEDLKKDTYRLANMISLELWLRLYLNNEKKEKLSEKLLQDIKNN